jgi:peptide chain release factor subunit 1
MARLQTAAAAHKLAASDPDITTTLQRVSRIPAGKHWVVSCYVRATPIDRTRARYLERIRSRGKAALAALDRLPVTEAARAAAGRDMERVIRAVSKGNLPAAGGFVAFACEAAGVFEVVGVPEVYRTRIMLDRSPRVRELVELDAEFGRVLAVIADRTHARFFDVGALGAREVIDTRPVAMRGAKFHSDRQGSPGWGERAYHNRIEQERERHYAYIAQTLRDLDRAHPAAGFVIGGPSVETRRLARFLDSRLHERVLGTVAMDARTLTAARVYRAVAPVRAEAQRAAARTEAHRADELAGKDWAVRGIRATLRALFRGQLRTLLVAAGVEHLGWRCPASGRLVLQASECRAGDGRPAISVPDVIDDAVEEALHQGIRIVTVPADSAGYLDDGLAGVLRWR